MSFGPNVTATTRKRPPRDPVRTDVPFEFVHINKCGGSSIEIALGLTKSHDTAAIRRDKIGAEAWDKAFTFATIRNPFDRIVSIYYYRVRTDQGGMADRHLNINDWVREALGERNPAYFEGNQLLWPALRWLSDDDQIIVDHIARLEDIEMEWREICTRLGIDRRLSVFNNNLHPPHGAILNAASRAVIEDVFAEDLETFGYRFETI